MTARADRTRNTDELRREFILTQLKKYLTLRNKNDYTTSEEKEILLRLIDRAFHTNIEPELDTFLDMGKNERDSRFFAVKVDFPVYPGDADPEAPAEQDDTGIGEDTSAEFEESEAESIDDDEDLDGLIDDDDGDDWEELADEDVFEEIPEEDREDVVMLMIAFPALREAGFPIDRILGGDYKTDLSDRQRQQIDWGLQLAYKVSDLESSGDPKIRRELLDDLREFAAAFLPDEKIDLIISEMRETYRKGV